MIRLIRRLAALARLHRLNTFRLERDHPATAEAFRQFDYHRRLMRELP